MSKQILIVISAKVNIVNTGGDSVFRSFCPSFVPSFVPSVYMMTHNGNDVIAATAPAAMLAITFSSLSPASKRFFLLPPLPLL